MRTQRLDGRSASIRSAVLSLALGIAFLAGVSAASAQTTAQLTGTVKDDSGAVIPGAAVTIISVDTGAERAVTTDATGAYNVPLLPAGNYRLHVESQGFRTVNRQDIRLEVNQTIRLDFTLEVGQVTETVEVRGAPPPLESDTSAIGQVIETRAVEDLPLNGRSFVQLAILAPGVNGAGFGAQGTIQGGSRPDDLRPGSELFTNGLRENANNFEIDGNDNNDRLTLSINLRPSVEAIREFKMETSNFKAEQGRSAGATVNVITKSGTNEFHGSAYWFYRNRELDSKNFFDRGDAEKPFFNQNQFGATGGGPAIKNKLFFFGSYEGFRKVRANTGISTVPTAAMRQGDFGAVRDIFDPFSTRPDPNSDSGFARDPLPGRQIPTSMFDEVTPKLFAGVPLPDSPGLANNLRTTPTQRQRWDQGMGRIDWNLSDRDRLFGRFSRQDTTTVQPSTFPEAQIPGIDRPVALGSERTFAGDSNLKSWNTVINYNRTFSPNLLLDARVGFSRFDLNFIQEGATPGARLGEQLGVRNSNQGPFSDGIPIFFPAGYQEIGQTRSLPIIRVQNTYNYEGNLTYIRGRHTFKGGIDVRRRQMTVVQTNRGNGRFNFNNGFSRDPNNPGATGDSIADVIIGTPSVIEQDFALFTPGLRGWEVGGFFQDDIRLTNKLTLNLGLRYEWFSRFNEVADRIANFDPISGQQLIAGFNSDKFTNVEGDFNNWAPRFGFAYRVNSKTVVRGGFGIFYNPGSSEALALRLHRQLPFSPINSVNIDQFDPNPRRVQDGFDPIPSLDFEGAANNPSGALLTLPADFENAMVMQYNLQVQRSLSQNIVLKVGYVGNQSRDVDTVFNFNQPFPGPGAPGPRRPLRDIAPNVTNVNYQASDGRGNYNALQASVEKRFSGGLSFLSSYTYSHSIDNVPNAFGGANNGPVPQDTRNRNAERASSGFDVRHRFTQALNWELPVGNGRLYDPGNKIVEGILGGWQTNAIFTAQSGLPFTPVLQDSVSNAGGSRPDLLGDPSIDNPDPAHFFNTSFNQPGAVFGQPELFTFGNAGRNILTGPKRVNLDLSVFKRFPIRERFNMEFRAEFFNVFNNPQFATPNARIGNPNAGTITSTVGNERQIQFGLKLSF